MRGLGNRQSLDDRPSALTARNDPGKTLRVTDAQGDTQPATHPPRRRVWRVASALCLAAMAVPLVHFATRPLQGGDIFWMVRAGEDILRGAGVADTERWSYTVAGTPWNNHEWLFEALAAALHRLGGYNALRALVLVLFGGALARVAAAAWRRPGPTWAVLAVGAGTALASFKLIPAPQTASMALFVLAAFAFLRRDEALSTARLAALGATLLVWANTTAEVVTFLPFLALDRALWLWDAPLSREGKRRELVWLSLAAAMILVTPRASSVLEYALTGSRINREVNAEFAPLWRAAVTVPAFVKQLGGVLVVAWALWAAARLRTRGVSAASLRALSAGALACLGATLFERNLWLLMVPAADLALALVARAGAGRRRDALDAAALAGGLTVMGAFCVAIGWSPAVAARAWSSPTYRQGVDARNLPVECLAPGPPFVPGVRVLSSRLWSGYLLGARPEARVFVDGRNREYPAVLHRAANDVIAARPEAQAVLDASGTELVLAWPGWSDAPALRGSGWRPVRRGRNCALYARGPRPATP